MLYAMHRICVRISKKLIFQWPWIQLLYRVWLSVISIILDAFQLPNRILNKPIHPSIRRILHTAVNCTVSWKRMMKRIYSRRNNGSTTTHEIEQEEQRRLCVSMHSPINSYDSNFCTWCMRNEISPRPSNLLKPNFIRSCRLNCKVGLLQLV